MVSPSHPFLAFLSAGIPSVCHCVWEVFPLFPTLWTPPFIPFQVWFEGEPDIFDRIPTLRTRVTISSWSLSWGFQRVKLIFNSEISFPLASWASPTTCLIVFAFPVFCGISTPGTEAPPILHLLWVFRWRDGEYPPDVLKGHHPSLMALNRSFSTLISPSFQ